MRDLIAAGNSLWSRTVAIGTRVANKRTVNCDTDLSFATDEGMTT